MKCLFTKILPLMVCTLLTSLAFANSGTSFTLPDKPDRTILEHIPQGYEEVKALLGYLFDLQEKDKRPNALIHYALARIVAPPEPTDNQKHLLDSVQEKGWSKKAESLLPYLKSWQPAFQEIRKGAALDYAKGFGIPSDLEKLADLNCIRSDRIYPALCAEGLWFESQNEYRKALDNYMTLLAMGRDFTSPGNDRFAFIMSTLILKDANT